MFIRKKCRSSLSLRYNVAHPFHCVISVFYGNLNKTHLNFCVDIQIEKKKVLKNPLILEIMIHIFVLTYIIKNYTVEHS